MKRYPRQNRNPNPEQYDFETITFHIAKVDIVQLDLRFICDMLAATLSEQSVLSIRGRLRFALESDVAPLFERGVPNIELRAYLRLFHFSVPLWPLLVSPDDPWTTLVAIGNTDFACCYNAQSRRAVYRISEVAMGKFIESLYDGLASASNSLAVPPAEWQPYAKKLAARLQTLTKPAR